MEIKGENVGVYLQWTWTKGPSPPPHALNGGNPLIIGVMGPIANAYIHGTQTKVRPWPEIEHIHRGSITQLRCSAGTKSLPWP
jgi:hypothetical protein